MHITHIMLRFEPFRLKKRFQIALLEKPLFLLSFPLKEKQIQSTKKDDAKAHRYSDFSINRKRKKQHNDNFRSNSVAKKKSKTNTTARKRTNSFVCCGFFKIKYRPMNSKNKLNYFKLALIRTKKI